MEAGTSSHTTLNLSVSSWAEALLRSVPLLLYLKEIANCPRSLTKQSYSNQEILEHHCQILSSETVSSSQEFNSWRTPSARHDPFYSVLFKKNRSTHRNYHWSGAVGAIKDLVSKAETVTQSFYSSFCILCQICKRCFSDFPQSLRKNSFLHITVTDFYKDIFTLLRRKRIKHCCA